MTNEEAIEILKAGAPYNAIYRAALDLVIGAKGCEEERVNSGRAMTVFKYSEDEMYSGGGYTECDNCGQRFSNAGFPMIHDAKYCPDCGAKVLKGEHCEECCHNYDDNFEEEELKDGDRKSNRIDEEREGLCFETRFSRM